MIKLLVVDYIGNSKSWIEQFINLEKVEITRTLLISDKDQDKLIASTEWDYILVFEYNMRNVFLSLVNALKIPPYKIFYALDLANWSVNPRAAYSILKPREEGYNLFHRYLDLNLEQQMSNFITCTTVDGISYIATSKDRAIMPQMYVFRQNFVADEIKAFYQLSKKYYYFNETEQTGGGYFLDLGANIGTTCIYFKKKFNDQLKILAFEPDPTNYMLLKINLMLNHVDNDSIAERLGLGAEKSEQLMHINLKNPGNNSIYPDNADLPTVKINIVSLDDYIFKNSINCNEIKYIWIDTEGFEAQVILGAKHLISENSIPIFMEFNPTAWDKTDVYDELIEFLEKCYKSYISIPDFIKNNGTSELHPIRELLKFKGVKVATGSMGDIFLVR